MIHKVSILHTLVLCILLLLSGCNGTSGEQARKQLIDSDWKFCLNAPDSAMIPGFDDSEWAVVDLPHDWSAEPVNKADTTAVGPFSKLSEGGFATGNTVGGTGFYRREFTLSPDDAGKNILIYFEGAYAQSEVWVNGRKAGENVYGYSPFRFDVTALCNAPGEPNVIAVRVVNQGKNSRWYAGSGIYRHVWLMKTPAIHLDEWTTAVRTLSLEDNKAEIAVDTEIFGGSGQLTLSIVAPDGSVIATQTAEGSGEVGLTVPLSGIQPWSPDTPVMYEALLSLRGENGEEDSITIPFGIRTLSFSATDGFRLNGTPMLLRGGCVHHDNGLLGAASIDRAEARKVELLKANGFNAVRTSHNVPAEAFLRACDEQGLLVIDEAFDQWQKEKNPHDYHLYFDRWSDRDVSAMVRRDRNHPSVVMWSIGNEIQERSDTAGMRIAARLRNTVRELDGTRPVTAAICDYWDNTGVKWGEAVSRAAENLDIAGYNYMWYEYENDHATAPDRIIYGSETVAQEAAVNWNLVEKHPYLIGDFVWTALDYLGEAGIGHTSYLKKGEKGTQFMPWPWFSAWCGDIDFCGNKKPQSYYRDVVWRLRDIAVASQPVPEAGLEENVSYWGWRDEDRTWNHPGCENRPVRVNVYSRSPRVRLYLNGQPVAEGETDKDFRASFLVNYEPGQLRAVTLGEKGDEGTSDILETTGAPAAIRLTADRRDIMADRNDLSYISIDLVDADGRIVPDADRPVSLSVSGDGILRGSGNACPVDMQSFRSATPSTFRGRAMAVLQPDGMPGNITLTVTADGLPAAAITVTTK